MRENSGRNASCRATSLPIPALPPVINTVFPGSVLIGIPSHFSAATLAVCRFVDQAIQNRQPKLDCQIHLVLA
jgi:hypothetical protein